jgi:probable F420-dependent oxidoreductase
MTARHPFRFGVINETPLPGNEMLRHVQRIEQLGFDTFLMRDHFTPDFFGDQIAPIPALAAAAAVTTQLRLGTIVFDNDFRHPVILAKELATIDSLSEGRLEFGVGAGWLKREYEIAGMTYDRAGVRISRLEEALVIFKGLFRGGPFSFNGDHYCITEHINFPQTVQRPHPPIMVGGGKPRMLRIAGAHADIINLLTTSVASGVLENDPTERLASTVDEKLGWIRQGAGDRFPSIELSLIPSVILTDDPRTESKRLIQERNWRNVGVEDVLEMPSMFIGSLDQIIDTMRQRRERFGFSYYVFSDRALEQASPIVAALRGQ